MARERRRQWHWRGNPGATDDGAPKDPEWLRWCKKPWIQAALLILLTVVAYYPALHGGYVWDDDDYVTNNPTLLTVEGLWRIWSDPSATPQYYPLVHTTYWVEHRLWGFHPLGYHFDNVLLHALGAVLVWRILIRLSVPGAWLAAGLFALHPVHVESVAWITERKNVLSGMFYFWALLACLQGFEINDQSLRKGLPGRGRHYWAALALFAAALLSKTVASTLPAAVLLLVWWKRGRVGWMEVWRLTPMFVLGLGFGLTTSLLEKYVVGAGGAGLHLSFIERVLVAGRVLWFYAGKLLWPEYLVFNYPRWQIDAGVAWQYAWPALALAVIGTFWLLRGRVGRGPLTALLYFAGTLFPALGFIDVYPMRYSFVADHFQYLASLGIIASVAALVARSAQHFRRPLLLNTFAAVVLPMLAVLTWRQCWQYSDIETLWSRTLAGNPGSWLAHSNLGKLLSSRGQTDEAMIHYQRAVELAPDQADTHFNLANALYRAGRFEEARAQYEKTLEITPGDVDALNNLARALITDPKASPTDRLMAVGLAQEGRRISGGGHLRVLRTLAAAYAETGHFSEAVETVDEALGLAAPFGDANLLKVLQDERALYLSGLPPSRGSPMQQPAPQQDKQ